MRSYFPRPVGLGKAVSVAVQCSQCKHENPTGTKFFVADGHLDLGKLDRRTGKRQQAQEHLSIATTLCRDMDMRFWREQADAELAELC